MAQTFTVNHYSIVLSLNEKHIYVKIVDTLALHHYEGIATSKELPHLKLKDAFAVMAKCFQGESGYEHCILVNPGVMKIRFDALVGGFLALHLDLFLAEKILTDDGQVTMTMNQLEQRICVLEEKNHALEENNHGLEEKNKEITAMLHQLSFAEVCLVPYINGVSTSIHVPLNVKIVTLSGSGSHIRWESIAHLYNLENLTLSCTSDTNLLMCKNNSVKSLRIINFKTILGIDSMPNLEHLAITNEIENNVVAILQSYDHKLKTISLTNCPKVNSIELQTYCRQNNIVLEIK